MKFETKYLSEVYSFQEGPGVRKFQFKNEGVKLLNVGNINNGILDTGTTKLFISNEEANGKYKHFLVDEGDLVIASSGIVVNNFHNKIAFARKEHLPLCLNTSTIRFKSLNNNVSLDYLKFFLKTPNFKTQLKKLITGSAQLNFGPSHLKKIKIPIPLFSDQLHIENILNQAENLITQRKESIRLLDEFLKSTFLEMFGNPINNEKGWPLLAVSKIGESRLGKMLDGKKIIGNNLKPYLRNSNVLWFKFKLDELLKMDFDEKDRLEFALKYGDILMCEGGEIGRCAIWKEELEECYIQKAIHRIRLKREYALPEYFVFMFWLYTSVGGLKKFMGAATISHLTGEKLKKMKLPIPPIPLQTQFAQIVEKTEALKTQYQQSLQELESLYGSLSQRAFKGEFGAKDGEIMMEAETK